MIRSVEYSSNGPAVTMLAWGEAGGRNPDLIPYMQID